MQTTFTTTTRATDRQCEMCSPELSSRVLMGYFNGGSELIGGEIPTTTVKIPHQTTYLHAPLQVARLALRLSGLQSSPPADQNTKVRTNHSDER